MDKRERFFVSGIIVAQITLIVESVAFLISVELDNKELGYLIEISGKNRLLTSYLIQDTDEYMLGRHTHINHASIKESEENILLLRDGGTYQNVLIKPLPAKYYEENQLLYEKFLDLRNNIEQLEKTSDEQELVLLHEIIVQMGFEITGMADRMTKELAKEFRQNTIDLVNHQITIAVINIIIHLVLVIILYSILKKELLKEQKNRFLLEKHVGEQANLRNALDASSIVAITNIDGKIKYVNDKFCDITKYSRNELIGKDFSILKSGYHSKKFYNKLWNTISSGNVWTGDMKNKTKDGSHYWVRTTIYPVRDGNVVEEYIAIITDTTEIYEKYELEEKIDQMEKANTLKNEFVAMVTHELKTPLTIIDGYAKMLDSNRLGDLSIEQKKATNEIVTSTKELRQFIDDILTLQTLESGMSKFEQKNISLQSFMQEIFHEMSPIMAESKIGFANSTDTDVQIVADEQKLRQVFSNLIRNALDFLPETNGMIEIGMHDQTDKDVVLFVKDNGIGIPLKLQKFIFQKFWQADTSPRRKHGGTGLGLSICMEFVKGMNGDMWVKSKEDVGTEFYFSIPKTKRIR